MEVSRKSCRLCLSETEFNVSLFGNYCCKTNMLDKILVCLRLPIEKNESLSTICHRCAENVERYYDFITSIKKAQTKLGYGKNDSPPRNSGMKIKHENKNIQLNQRLVTVREQVIDADYTFSFLDTSNFGEKNVPKSSSPFFSYFSPPNPRKESLNKLEENGGIWKTPQQKLSKDSQRQQKQLSEKFRKYDKFRKDERPRHLSGDLFDSQSQNVEEPEPKSVDWRLTPDDNIIKRVREKCFGLSDF